jgi:hypothetical protein
MSNEPNDALERAKAERRQYQRVRVELAGRLFLPGDGSEAPCQIVGLSPGGAQVVCETVPAAEAQAVLYIDGFGRFEGNVVRLSEHAFVVQFHCSQAKREKIAEQLTLYLNRDLLGEVELRRHEREPTKGLAHFTRANGDVVTCEVLDLSLSGVSLKTDARPPVGEVVSIGQTSGRVVRHHENGIAIEFHNAHPVSHEAPANPFTVVG